MDDADRLLCVATSVVVRANSVDLRQQSVRRRTSSLLLRWKAEVARDDAGRLVTEVGRRRDEGHR